MTTRPVTLLIYAGGCRQSTRRLLDSVERFTDPAAHDTIVVDDATVDDRVSFLTPRASLRIIRDETKLGFARAANAARKTVDVNRDVVLMSSDVEVLQSGWLERLQQAAYSAPGVGIAGCRIVRDDGRLLHAGLYVVPEAARCRAIGALELDVNQYAGTRVVQGVAFHCAYIRRAVLDDAGPLSEDVEPALADIDYCLRARERGYVSVCCGAVTMRRHTLPGDETSGEVGAHFASRWSRKLEQRYTMTAGWQSIMNLPTGYAMSCREILRALDERGVRASYSYAFGPGTPIPVQEPEHSGDPRLDAIRSRRDTTPVVVTYAPGNLFHRNRGRYRAGFTMIEVDGFPADWVRQANDMDELWTPTEFNRQGMIRSGVRKPVHVVPLGIDPNHFHPQVTRVPNPHRDYVFLTSFEWGDRKAPEIVLSVFNRTFRAAEPVILLCKVLNRRSQMDVGAQIRSLGLDEDGGRIHVIHNREVPYAQLPVLYRSADCFVTASRGEGWGLPVIESLACGTPAIATNWGGLSAILDPRDSYPLRVAGEISASGTECSYYHGFRWADPDREHLATLLRHVYEHRDEAREKGLRAAARVCATLTWAHTAEAIEARLRSIGTR